MVTERSFDPGSVLPRQLFFSLTDLRLAAPEEVRAHARGRQRRPVLAPSGKLVLLAADHPGRMVTAALGQPLAMADRHAYLARILRVLTSDTVDGLMATPDIIEEVLALDLLLTRHGAPGLLAGKLLVGCMNRGGLQGTSFELRDTFTAYDAQGLVAMNLDAGKLMFRLDPTDPASGETITWCAAAINDLLDLGLPAFVEPLVVQRQGERLVVQNDPVSLAQICGVASALGRSSLATWLKLPYGPDYAQVAAATTCPILMLGGEASGDPRSLLEDIAAGMAAGPNVRGTLIGRNVLFPGRGDPLALAAAIRAVVFDGAAPEVALRAGAQHAATVPWALLA